MRFIHTADWHLGRLMHGERLTDDQAHVLAQLVDLVRDVKPMAVLVAGDVYDRAVPPPDAVALLDEVLSSLVLDLDVTVIIIAGNHDSPLRLEFGSKVLARRGLHVVGSPRADASPVTLSDDSGPAHFYAIPFAEPAMVRERLACETLPDHNAAMQAMIERIRAGHPQKERSVLVAHAFVAGGVECESERPLSVGGADRVDTSSFGGFDYVALGHLHRPQQAGSPQIRYAGSLLKYSFSEVDHAKSVNVVEMDERGACRVESVALTPRRDVRRISGFLHDILKGPAPGESSDDYMMVTLHDRGAILDVMGKLRDVYPNVLHVERPGVTAARKEGRQPADHRKLNDADLFAAFFSEVTGTDLSESEAAAYQVIVDASRQREREAAST